MKVAHFLYISLSSQAKLKKLNPSTLQSQNLGDVPEQEQLISSLGSQVESCGRSGVESEAPLLELISLSYALHYIGGLRLCMGISLCSCHRKKYMYFLSQWNNLENIISNFFPFF